MTLRELWISTGMTQGKFAGLLGYNRMSLRNYLQGRLPEHGKKYMKLVEHTIQKEGINGLQKILEG